MTYTEHLQISRGEDSQKIEDRGEPKSILVELSGDPLESTKDLFGFMEPLMKDLFHRSAEDSRRFGGRRPQRLIVRWRRTARMIAG